MQIYDHQFNQNEWFTLIVLLVTYLIVFKLPKRFSTATTVTLILIGVYIGMLCDHTISVGPFDFYDVNDDYTYEFFDFLTYVMYGPFSYLFLYYYDYFNINGFKILLYAILWSLLALGMEFVALKFGVFHYKQGYRLLYSIPIYLIIQSIVVLYFYLLRKNSSTL